MSGVITDVAYLTRALKMPRARQVAASLAETARAEGWDYTEFLAKVLTEEVASRETHGGENRVKAARFPQVKTLDDYQKAIDQARREKARFVILRTERLADEGEVFSSVVDVPTEW